MTWSLPVDATCDIRKDEIEWIELLEVLFLSFELVSLLGTGDSRVNVF